MLAYFDLGAKQKQAGGSRTSEVSATAAAAAAKLQEVEAEEEKSPATADADRRSSMVSTASGEQKPGAAGTRTIASFFGGKPASGGSGGATSGSSKRANEEGTAKGSAPPPAAAVPAVKKPPAPLADLFLPKAEKQRRAAALAEAEAEAAASAAAIAAVAAAEAKEAASPPKRQRVDSTAALAPIFGAPAPAEKKPNLSAMFGLPKPKNAAPKAAAKSKAKAKKPAAEPAAVGSRAPSSRVAAAAAKQPAAVAEPIGKDGNVPDMFLSKAQKQKKAEEQQKKEDEMLAQENLEKLHAEQERNRLEQERNRASDEAVRKNAEAAGKQLNPFLTKTYSREKQAAAELGRSQSAEQGPLTSAAEMWQLAHVTQRAEVAPSALMPLPAPLAPPAGGARSAAEVPALRLVSSAGQLVPGSQTEQLATIQTAAAEPITSADARAFARGKGAVEILCGSGSGP